jgi:nitric oxide reductase NorQ protein
MNAPDSNPPVEARADRNPADPNPVESPRGGRSSQPDIWYQPLADEVEVFEAAWAARLPVLLKGPTGCGKTRFVEFMAARLRGARRGESGRPLITISCHEDLTANDLVGRHLLMHDRTVWQDGPLTRAAREGAIVYLDEIVEARRDTTVVIHSLTDHRRILPIEKTGELLQAHEDFLLVISYNPGLQNVFKELKASTRQRFVTLEFNYPQPDLEALIVARESGVDTDTSRMLAAIAQRLRALHEHQIGDAVSTRALVHAARLIAQGITPRRACIVALAAVLGEDPELAQAARDVIEVMVQ